MPRAFRAFAADRGGGEAPDIFDGESGRFAAHPEEPGRWDALRAGLKRARIPVTTVGDEADDGELTRIHDPGMIAFLREMAAADSAERPLFPDSFPPAGPFPPTNPHPPTRPPGSLGGRFGYYCTDVQTPFDAQYWTAALRSSRCALEAARAVSGGCDAYALCRPPGHHAGRGFFGGFCYLNNTALAAEFLSRDSRVAVLDVDYHHGNGTQDCFYDNPDVFTCSVHADPDRDYPYFSGRSDETGKGAGLGANRNIPLAKGTDVPPDWFRALETGLEAIRGFGPAYLVVAFGADTYREDPVGGLSLDVEDFRRLGRAVRGTGVPFLVVQEGGYSGPALTEILAAFLEGLEAGGAR